MIRVFIGFDPVESVAYHVLVNSIIRHSSEPVSFTPIGNTTLPSTLWRRPRGTYDSTEFSNARFMVPRLCEYHGWAIFMDCDMLCRDNIADLWEQRLYGHKKAVLVKKHRQEVTSARKFLGAKQTAYRRKNWSSLMLINCEHPYWKTIDPEHDHGLDLHQFANLPDNEIGEIEGEWNTLLKVGGDFVKSSLIHFTLGGPWHGWSKYPEVYDWRRELEEMLVGSNPCASIGTSVNGKGDLSIGGVYAVQGQDEEAQEALETSTEGLRAASQ